MSTQLRPHRTSRRNFLKELIGAVGAVAAARWVAGCGGSGGGGGGGNPIPPAGSPFASIGPLLGPDANGIRLPGGFTSRVVAVSGETPVVGGGYPWHAAPDGGATYARAGGGWAYACNSETSPGGGVGTLVFAPDGTVLDAYSILNGTRRNCAGGKSPWATWLSCEEVPDGMVFECDPVAAGQGVVVPTLGLFNHEALAVDPVARILYLTEDAVDGRFYRFVPTAADWPAAAPRPALQAGVLQVLRFSGAPRGLSLDEAGLGVGGVHLVEWEDVLSPGLPQGGVRAGLPAAPGSKFLGGEGLWFFDGVVYFATKIDNRIWAYDRMTETLEVVYDFATAASPILSGVDNLTVSEFGDVLVAEDGGDMQVCVIVPNRSVIPLLQASDVTGTSEITGVAFSPDGSRLYFNAQRNGRNGAGGQGITFEVTLPFSACPGGCP